MTNQRKSLRANSRAKKQPNRIFYAVIASVILFVTIFYFYTKKISTNDQEYTLNIPSVKSPPEQTIQAQLEDTPFPSTAATNTNITNTPIPVSDLSLLPEIAQIPEENILSTSEDFESAEKANPSMENNPVVLIQKLNNFYEHLDQQSYMQDFKLNEPSSVHFSKLLQKLINTPPVVTNETNDLFTLLKNTAHFFRILGKDNILILKGILDREKSSFEDVLRAFYALTDYPEAMAEEYSLKLPKDGLYDYAGFFLNTMGGRLYLFRRDSASRMTVSFYAILVIDKANDEEYNKYGIDIRPAIDFLIDEIENTGKRLLLKEIYLDGLYDLKEKYN